MILKNGDVCNGASFKTNGWGRKDKEPFHLDWMHGDMKDMAYFYIHKLYDSFLEKGGVQ